MSRLIAVLALLGFAMGAASLWIAADASAVHAAELGRMETARGELESLLSMSNRTAGQLAELRSELVKLGGQLAAPPQRVAIPLEEQGAGSAAKPGEGTTGAGPAAGPADLAQRYRTLSAEGKRAALEDLVKRARWGDAEALALVLDGLNDSSPAVREKAAKMLGDLANPALVGHLRRAAADQNADVRAAVAKSLEKLPGQDAGPILIDMLRDAEPAVVAEAIKTLAKLEYPQARPYLTEQLAAEDLEVAARAAAALRGMGDEGAAHGTINRIMRDYARGDDKVRIRDVKWLRRVGGASAIAQLRTIMETDPSLSVREEARTAIAKLGG